MMSVAYPTEFLYASRALVCLEETDMNYFFDDRRRYTHEFYDGIF